MELGGSERFSNSGDDAGVDREVHATADQEVGATILEALQFWRRYSSGGATVLEALQFWRRYSSDCIDRLKRE
jgi:hypothetical protein